MEKIENQIVNKLDNIERQLTSLNKDVTDIKISQARLQNDNSWIKWLFGGLLSFILILLSIIITLLFKLVN